MLSEFRIGKLVESGHYGHLLDDLVHNGRPVSLSVRVRLGDPAVVVPATLGLAIQRMTEITFATSGTTRRLGKKRCRMPRATASFASA